MAEKLSISGLTNGGDKVLSGIESLSTAQTALRKKNTAGIRPGHARQ
jgi:hypothetical protein